MSGAALMLTQHVVYESRESIEADTILDHGPLELSDNRLVRKLDKAFDPVVEMGICLLYLLYMLINLLNQRLYSSPLLHF